MGPDFDVYRGGGNAHGFDVKVKLLPQASNAKSILEVSETTE